MAKTKDSICKKRQRIYAKIALLKRVQGTVNEQTSSLIDKKIKKMYSVAARLNGRTHAQRKAGFS